ANGQTQRLNAYFADKASSNKLLDVEYATLAKAYWKDLAAVEMLYQLDLVNEQSDAEKDKRVGLADGELARETRRADADKAWLDRRATAATPLTSGESMAIQTLGHALAAAQRQFHFDLAAQLQSLELALAQAEVHG